jgi:hypothetical protein
MLTITEGLDDKRAVVAGYGGIPYLPLDSQLMGLRGCGVF